MPSNVAAIIQARMASTRLANKVLLKIKNKPVLEHIIKRVQAVRRINKVIVATTVKTEDLQIVRLCATLHINLYCGSVTDVLDRYYQTARLYQINQVVRITADNPLIDPGIIDDCILLHQTKDADYTSNTLQPTYPDGEDVEVISFSALQKTWQKANLFSEREHVTPFIHKHKRIFRCASLEYGLNLSSKRWTMDNPEDFIFIKKIYDGLYQKNKLFDLNDIINFITKRPYLEKINQHIGKNEGYLRSLKQDKK